MPSFLKNATNKDQCQVHGGDQEMLRCGQTDVYIKPECVCSFFHVYEATLYHKYSSCPDAGASDIVTQLKCETCKQYSLNNNGPCINGGKLICKGDEVAPKVKCQCPQNYEGDLCEYRIENIIRICDRIFSSSNLTNCDRTGSECVTYSRNKRYTYKCQETNTSQDRQGLPLCLDTEDTTPNPTDVISVDPDETVPGNPPSKAARIQFSDVFAVALFTMFFKHFIS
uniref:Uncharacterized protein LOC111115793 n=1 Tax=Crassostrea virginica TaxID=6565 RepID=A0A8B8C5F9_CRAVI|nr:uncharacterized protein LOC111115793 [Crassostrea virginica]